MNRVPKGTVRRIGVHEKNRVRTARSPNPGRFQLGKGLGQELLAGPVGFEPTAPGLPRSVAGLEGRCFGHPEFRSTGAVQAELRARYAHTGLLPISAFFSAPSSHTKTEVGFDGTLLHVDRGAEGLSCLSATFRVVLLLVRFAMNHDRTLEFLA